MGSSDLEDLCSHINGKISNIKKTLQLRNIGQEPSLKAVLSKIGYEMSLLNEFLNKLELEVQRQEHLRNSLKELQESIEGDYKEVEHLKENVPPHLPQVNQSCSAGPNVKTEEQDPVAEPGHTKKLLKQQKMIKEALLITAAEFNTVPAYMKSRLTYCQINDVVQEINKAVTSKYKILQQPKKSMSSAVRNLYHRFLEEETKDTKGQFFIVEADIKEFTNLKLDKRFHVILNILRHCRRLSEVRGAGLVRYVIS
ncbi:spindle and kinetochore-associated protein 1 isoform X1 [Ornithorhynchus anatinus]|uniref:spindle and kinetochore-associated protein 1 isoform X1 n=1 Tax=Ornithorhynchus anatinus TaxID=9258 RepID=UPI0000EDF3BE|nr:spindle and kinetochore-associated protein 1 isoform X1 [Ornithorhynchus anatinus]